MNLSTITTYLDTFLNTASVADYPQAQNGLQLSNDGKVTRIVVAVDACQAVIEEAVVQKADLLIVHHGLFWQGLQPLTGAFYKKMKLAMDHNLAIYSSHLPLDLHPKVGNNILLAEKLGLHECRPALQIKGELLGLAGKVAPIARSSFLKKVSLAVGGSVHQACILHTDSSRGAAKPYKYKADDKVRRSGCMHHPAQVALRVQRGIYESLCKPQQDQYGICRLSPGGPSTIKKVLVVTGGAGSEVAAAVAEGVDTFVTGEGPHWSYTTAEELGVNLIYAGHYATETFGVKALGEMLSKKFKLPWGFIHHPTGL